MKTSKILNLSVTIYPEESAEAFAFDACEAVYLLACAWGEYEALTYLLNVLEFKPSPSLSYDTLTDDGRNIYNMLDDEMVTAFHRQQYNSAAALGNWLKGLQHEQN